jgi:hypothetical protein
MKNYITSTFFGLKNPRMFFQGINIAIQNLNNNVGIFTGDNVFTFGKNLSFYTNEKFMDAFNKYALTDVEKATIWRISIVAWGALNGMKLQGDLVEIACYKGVTARIVCDYIDFINQKDRKYYLYDLFEHDDQMNHHGMPEHGPTLFEQVQERFTGLDNVVITKGMVPQSLAVNCPEKIAFMHLDLNNAEAEIGALEILFDKMVPGAVLVLDDYGWIAYRRQKIAEDAWFADRGYHVIELPTGQGLLIKQ